MNGRASWSFSPPVGSSRRQSLQNTCRRQSRHRPSAQDFSPPVGNLPAILQNSQSHAPSPACDPGTGGNGSEQSEHPHAKPEPSTRFASHIITLCLCRSDRPASGPRTAAFPCRAGRPRETARIHMHPAHLGQSGSGAKTIAVKPLGKSATDILHRATGSLSVLVPG